MTCKFFFLNVFLFKFLSRLLPEGFSNWFISIDTHLHWFMCRSQLSEKLNNLSFAKAFCRSVSGCVIGGTPGWIFTIDPGPVRRPSLLVECPLAPEWRLRKTEQQEKRDSSCKNVRRRCRPTHPSLFARLFLLRRPTCGCTWTCCLGTGTFSIASEFCTFKKRFTFSIAIT